MRILILSQHTLPEPLPIAHMVDELARHLVRRGNEVHVLTKGQVFVNPQDSGTGVKLKSIIAMAAGRTLVSTDIGLEGVVGNNGEHFVSVSSVLEMFDHLITLMKDRRLANNIGIKARQIAAENYSIGSLDGQVDELFRELLNDVSVNDVSVIV